MQFEGWVQFSTFTRWCWILEGVYFTAANVAHYVRGPATSRIAQILFGVATASAMMVTTVTYGVLVPGALLIPMPEHRQGSIEVLLSWQGHTMHSANSLFMICDTYLSKQSMQRKDMIYGIGWGISYVLFEWVFYAYTDAWHYPFMNYNAPFAVVIYAVLLGVFSLYWYIGCKASDSRLPKADRSS
jgi:hypothetical protein